MKKQAAHKPPPHTVSTVLTFAMKHLKKRHMPSVSLDAEVLLAYALKKDRMFLLAHPEYHLKASEYARYTAYIRERLLRIPVAYITGQKEFYGHSFFVNNHVLIPRPETELLVEEACLYLRQHSEKISLLDVGTGSGCVPLSIVKEMSMLKIVCGTDISSQALEIARKNARALALEKRVTFQKTHMFGGIKNRFDCITANLPYVSTKEYTEAKKACPEIQYEPKNAICAGRTGLEFFEIFFQQVSRVLRVDGCIFLEIGSGQKQGIEKLTKTYLPKAQLRFVRDMSNRIRLAMIQN